LVKEGESVIVPGKVLSKGDINKKIKIIALNFSEKAKQKISNNKGEINYIIEEIKKNPNANGLRLLK
ncbi:MAG: uL15 family ribosomal protein, partial [Nanoarchaeota archaeon]